MLNIKVIDMVGQLMYRVLDSSAPYFGSVIILYRYIFISARVPSTNSAGCIAAENNQRYMSMRHHEG